MKSALFVDFDNIYSGLRRLDPATADRFAKSPMDWVSWMVNSMALPKHVTGTSKRRILVRRCYLNPQMYQHFRPFFNMAGFEITDCPVLTSGGKTSTDIQMVLDIVDLLQHEAHYDDFIVLSADADFTPVLRKLRRWDRRTTILAIGFPSAAYRASADLVIDQDEFVRGALGTIKLAAAAEPTLVGAAPQPPKPAAPNAHVNLFADLVRREVGAIAGTGGVRAPGHVHRTACRRHAGRLVWQRHIPPFPRIAGPGAAAVRLKADGGVVYDPQRHARGTAAPAATTQEWTADSTILSMARQLNELAGVPLLAPARYRAMFQMLSADLAAYGYDFLETAKRVRDRCRDAGHPISRADIDFVLRGLAFRGHRFDEHSSAAGELTAKFVNNVRSLCLREQIVLDPATEATIRNWIGALD